MLNKRLYAKTNFLTQIFEAGENPATHELFVKLVGYSDVVEWDNTVGAGIREHTPNSLDAGWNWPLYHFNGMLTEPLRGRKVHTFQLQVRSSKNEAVPILQGMVSVPYKWPGPREEDCAFIWFLSKTPSKTRAEKEVPFSFEGLPYALDTAIEISKAYGLEGRIGLHAAAESLVLTYRKQSMLRRNILHWDPQEYFSLPFRRNDGLFFYFDALDAEQHQAKFASLQRVV